MSTSVLPSSPFMWGVAAGSGPGEKVFASLFRSGLYEDDFLNTTRVGSRNPVVGATHATAVQSIIGGAATDAPPTFWVGTGASQPNASFVTTTGGQ